MRLRALVRPPSPHLADGLLTHLERVPVDIDLARRQWDGYVEALTGAGWDPVEVPAVPECPDGVFVEDTVVMIGGTAVITHPGADTRRPETLGTSVTVRALGYPTAVIEEGTLVNGLFVFVPAVCGVIAVLVWRPPRPFLTVLVCLACLILFSR